MTVQAKDRAAEAKHTPGPWGIDERIFTAAHGYGHKASAGSIFVHGSGGRHKPIAGMFIRANGDNWNECAANARLIAAAPDLYQVCKWEETYRSLKGDDGVGEANLREEIGIGPRGHIGNTIAEFRRAAIARAEGGAA